MRRPQCGVWLRVTSCLKALPIAPEPSGLLAEDLQLQRVRLAADEKGLWRNITRLFET